MTTTEPTLATPADGTIRIHKTFDGIEVELADCAHCEEDIWRSTSWDWEHMDTDAAECPEEDK